VEHLWDAFGDLSRSRTRNGWAVSPISYVDILHYEQANGFDLHPWERRLIRLIDDVFIHTMTTKSKQPEGDLEKKQSADYIKGVFRGVGTKRITKGSASG
jgi:hypothetical protein